MSLLDGLFIPETIKSEMCGWLDSDGTFHPCEWMEHINLAYDLYGTYDTELLAKQGIAHILWNPLTNIPDYYIAKCLSDAQIKWLEDNEFEIRNEDIGKI